MEMEDIEVKKNNVADFSEWIGLETEELVRKYGTPIMSHILVTSKIALFWVLALLASTIIYIFAASLEFYVNSHADTNSGLYNLVWGTVVLILIASTVMLTLSSIRVGMYSASLAIFKSLSVFVLKVSYSIASAMIPDVVENLFDKDKKIEKLLEEAGDKDAKNKIAENLIRGYLSGVAWTLFVSWLVLILPLGVFSHPLYVLMGLVAGLILIYQVFGFDTEPFWYGLLQQASMYTAAGFIVYYLAVLPFLNWTGVFEGWGPSGYARTAFWFVVTVISLGIAFMGSKIEPNKHGNKNISFKGSSVAGAAVIFTAALLFGNLFLTSVLGAANWKNLGNSNIASNSNTSMVSSQSNSVTITNSNKSPVASQSTPKSVQQVVSVPQSSGQGLVAGRAYKFADSDQVFVFDGRKLNRVSGVSTPVNPMPSFVQPDSSVFGN